MLSEFQKERSPNIPILDENRKKIYKEVFEYIYDPFTDKMNKSKF